MLSKEQMDSIAVMTGIKADVLAQAISDEKEVKLELPKGRFLTEDNEATLLDNHGKKKYDEGISKASRDAFDGKTKEDFLTGFKTSILEEANIEPNQKLTEKEEAFRTLQEKYQTDIKLKDNEISEFQSKFNRMENDLKIDSVFPELKDGISKLDARILFNATHETKEDGVYKDGKLLVNDIQSPLGLEEAAQLFIKEKGWRKEAPKGHGGKKPSEGGTSPKSYNDFQKYCESKGINEGSLEAKEYLSTLRAKNPQFEMN